MKFWCQIFFMQNHNFSLKNDYNDYFCVKSIQRLMSKQTYITVGLYKTGLPFHFIANKSFFWWNLFGLILLLKRIKLQNYHDINLQKNKVFKNTTHIASLFSVIRHADLYMIVLPSYKMEKISKAPVL